MGFFHQQHVAGNAGWWIFGSLNSMAFDIIALTTIR
jgi:hypothetical protein